MDSNYLETDACPSPPRDKSPSPTPQDQPEKPSSDDIPINENHFKPHKQKKSKPSSFKPKANVSNTSINIAYSKGIHLGNTFIINGKDKDSTSGRDEIVKTDKIIKLMENKEKLERSHITFVSQHIGKEWRFLGKHLRYSEGQLYQFEVNHKEKGFKEIIIKMLLDWTQTEPEDATLGKLASVLWECNEKDAVDRFAKFLYPH